MRTVVVTGMIVAGIGLVALGTYLAPLHAYEIQGPFREHGVAMGARVVDLRVAERSYVAGGQHGGETSFEELVVDVQLADGRTQRISDLVLASDHEALGVGDEVSVTTIVGTPGYRELPLGPFYLLSSSVDAGPVALLPWAFSGRPASGLAIAATVPGVCLLLLGLALAWDGRRRRGGDARAVGRPAARPLLFDWKPIDTDGPVSADYGDDRNFFVTPAPRAYLRNTVSALFRMHPIPGGFVTTWKTCCVARNLDGSLRWRLPGWDHYLAVSPDGTRLAVTRAGAGEIAIVDARTGQVEREFATGTRYVWQPAWTADGQRLLAIVDDGIARFDVHGAPLGRVSGIPDDRPVLGSLTRLLDGTFVVSHPNGRALLVLDESAVVRTVPEKMADNLFLAPSGKTLWIGATHGGYASAVPSLEPASFFRMPGKLGVRFAGQDGHSYTQFQPIPRVSDDERVVLVNDRTGQLWLMGAKGTPYHRWPREVLDAVEDTMWAGQDAFFVATNDQRIRKMTFYSYTPEIDVSDA